MAKLLTTTSIIDKIADAIVNATIDECELLERIGSSNCDRHKVHFAPALNLLRKSFKEGQRNVTPPASDLARQFNESLLQENPQSKMETSPLAKVIELMDDETAKVKADAEAAEKAFKEVMSGVTMSQIRSPGWRPIPLGR